MKNYKNDDMNSPDDVIYQDRLNEELNPDYSEDQPEVTESDDEIIKQFTEHKAAMNSKWDDIYSGMEEDWDIYTLDQWTESGKRARGKRPIVTVDICRKFVKTIVAETFRNPPGVKLTARKEDANVKAKAIADAIRYFEDRTGAIYAYSFAKECAAVAGIGWLKVTYRYDEQQAMPAVIDIDRVEDPLSIQIDPDIKELDGSDALFAYEDHGKKDGKDNVTYWWKSEDGLKVNWAVICDGKVVKDKGIFPGSSIPLVPVFGEIYKLRGKLKVFGIIRQLRDTQRSYNYTLSEGIERLALTPKNPIDAAEGSISQQYMGDWVRSMTEPVPIRFYKATDNDGATLPPPKRTDTNPDTAWLAPLVSMLQLNAKETVGIYDTALGMGMGDESGVAIKARQDQGDRGHLVYDEHLQISIKHVGRIALDLLEPVITPAGLLPILEEDGKVAVMSIGQPTQAIDPNTGEPAYDLMGYPVMDKPMLEDLDPTDLDISISAAPAYATRKQEGMNNITALLGNLPPEMMSAIIPKLIRDQDFPGSAEYADILDGGVNKQDPAMIQQQMQELQAQLQQANDVAMQLQQQNERLNIEIQNQTQITLAKTQMDNNTKMAIEDKKIQAQLIMKEMELNYKNNSDDKKIMTVEYQEGQENLRKLADISQKAEKDNADIALKAQKAQQDIISKIDVQPMTFIQ